MKTLLKGKSGGELIFGTLSYKHLNLRNTELILSPEINHENLTNLQNSYNLKKNVLDFQLEILQKEASGRQLEERKDNQESLINKNKKRSFSELTNMKKHLKWSQKNLEFTKTDVSQIDDRDLVDLINKKEKKLLNMKDFFKKISSNQDLITKFTPTDISHGFVGWIIDPENPNSDILYSMLTSQKDSEIFGTYINNIDMGHQFGARYINYTQKTNLQLFKKLFDVKSPSNLMFSKIFNQKMREEDVAFFSFRAFIKSITNSTKLISVVQNNEDALNQIKVELEKSILIDENNNCILPVECYLIKRDESVENLINAVTEYENKIEWASDIKRDIWDEACKTFISKFNS